jgi:hypothetical protein
MFQKIVGSRIERVRKKLKARRMEDWIKALRFYIHWALCICKTAKTIAGNGATRAKTFSRRPFSVSVYDIKVGGVVCVRAPAGRLDVFVALR